MDYIEIEEKLSDARTRFADAFGAIKNARIIKKQANNFALRFKYVLLMLLCVAGIADVVVFQVVLRQFDPLYIVCECVIIVALTAFIVLLAISWRINLQNAACCEIIDYYNGGIKCLYSTVAGGGSKVEWEAARFYFTKKGEAELFEGGAKEYRPFVYKKIRGHARNYVLLSAEAILANFFDGSEVTSDDGETVTLSSGFSFTVRGGTLVRFEITGMYSECYENNFPLYAPLSASSSYTFTYEFTEVNAPGFRLILPEIVRDACRFYFLTPPSDENIHIEDLKK